METSPQQVSQLLQRWSDGDKEALNELMPLVYGELRRIARRYMKQQSGNHTLQTTALIHEAYLRLVAQGEANWRDRAHFFGVAAQAMRHILVDYARTQNRAKRTGGAHQVSLDQVLNVVGERSTEFTALDDALTELSKVDERRSKVVELRFFGGLSEEEIAEVLDVSLRTVSKDWSFARAWLLRELSKTKHDI